MDFVKVAVGAGHHRQLVADTFGRLVNIGDIGEGVKTQGLPVQVHPAHIFAQGLVPVPMSNTTAKPPESSTLRISGCISPVLPAPEVPQTAML